MDFNFLFTKKIYCISLILVMILIWIKQRTFHIIMQHNIIGKIVIQMIFEIICRYFIKHGTKNKQKRGTPKKLYKNLMQIILIHIKTIFHICWILKIIIILIMVITEIFKKIFLFSKRLKNMKMIIMEIVNMKEMKKIEWNKLFHIFIRIVVIVPKLKIRIIQTKYKKYFKEQEFFDWIETTEV